jgi:hypothetical protein
MTTLREQTEDQPAAATYWRRRFIALVAGLSVLALLTWAVSSVLGGSTPAAGGNAASLNKPAAAGPAASPTAASARQRGSPPATHSHSAAGAGGGGLRPCPANDVVLSLFSSQAAYSVTQEPEFEVDVVSTASRSCTFNIGAKHVWVQINAGSLRVWSSAYCAEGEASLVTELQRGVPTVVPIGWDGEVSGQGCPGPGTAAPAGAYTAVAADGSGSSNALTFRIG